MSTPGNNQHQHPPRISGDYVERERNRRWWSQAQLAKRLGVSQSRVSELEKSIVISNKYLMKLDETFGGPLWRAPAPTYVKEPETDYGSAQIELVAIRQQLTVIFDELSRLSKAQEALEEKVRRQYPKAGAGEGGK
jgi:transcriptional regulator with XRE-family HTH domain